MQLLSEPIGSAAGPAVLTPPDSGWQSRTATSLWDEYRVTRSPEARDELVQQYLSLVHFVARRISMRAPTVEYQELVSAGNLGLLSAVEAFDPSRGAAFSTYAVPRIRGAILDELRRGDWLPRSSRARARRLFAARAELGARLQRAPKPAEVAEALGIELQVYWRWCDELDPACRAGGSAESPAPSGKSEGQATPELATGPDQLPDHDLLREEELVGLRAAIGELPERERQVMAMCYFEELSMREIAQVLRVTESRICQIRQRALGRLRERMVTR
jgi:RNA polymerase sigma factor for flagellar operon FliA